MKKIATNLYLEHEKNKWGLCWSAFAISIKNDEKYCPGIYNLKAPIISPMQFGLRRR